MESQSLDDLLGETTNLPAFDPAAEQKRPKRQRPGDAPNTATAGWGFGNSDGSQPVLQKPQESQPMRSKHHDDDDGDDVIPVIPDLEEEGEEEDITRQVAAPHISLDYNRDFRSLRELEPDNIEKQLMSVSAQQGVDLSALMQVMLPHNSVAEEDVIWDYGLIFQEVASYINHESTSAKHSPDDVSMTDEQARTASKSNFHKQEHNAYADQGSSNNNENQNNTNTGTSGMTTNARGGCEGKKVQSEGVKISERSSILENSTIKK